MPPSDQARKGTRANSWPCSLNRETEVLVPDDELAIPRSIDGGV